MTDDERHAAEQCKLELRMLYRQIRDEPWADEKGKAGVLTGIALSVGRLEKFSRSRESIHVWLNADKLERVKE